MAVLFDFRVAFRVSFFLLREFFFFIKRARSLHCEVMQTWKYKAGKPARTCRMRKYMWVEIEHERNVKMD